ncbi:MAG: flagellar motor protein MotB [Nitrospinota bacterium]
MARKKRHADHENLERWLISYADFITLLFALFVVLYGISEVDAQKLKKVSNSFQFAFSLSGTGGVEQIPMLETQIKERMLPVPVKSLEAITQLYPGELEKFEEVRKDIGDAIINDIINTRMPESVVFDLTERGLVIRLQSANFFAPGSAEIMPEVLPILDKVAKKLKVLKSHIRIEGHTDSIPISTSNFPSNWDLSAARASNIVKYLINKFQFPPERITVAAYGDSRPIAENEAETGRAKNRRIDIVVMSIREVGYEPLI